jgi:hypothetical protein
MTATVTDERRRLVMPPELPARSAVTVEQIDDETWVVRLQKPRKHLVAYLLPDVTEHKTDPEQDAFERRVGRHLNRSVPPFEE